MKHTVIAGELVGWLFGSVKECVLAVVVLKEKVHFLF